MKTTAEIKSEAEIAVKKLDAVSKKVGKGKPISFGTLFYAHLRDARLYEIIKGLKDVTNSTALKKGVVGYWRGHALKIIPGNMGENGMKNGMDDPRPCKNANK